MKGNIVNFSVEPKHGLEVLLRGVLYASVSQPLWDRGPVIFFIRRGPGPNKFTRKYLSNFFKFIIKLI